jgi:hypothetical protein
VTFGRVFEGLGLLTLCALSARADLVVFDSFGPDNAYNCCTGATVGLGITEGDQFSPSATGELSKFDIALSEGSCCFTHIVDLSLFADNGGSPGTLIESYTALVTTRFGTCCSVLTINSSNHPLLIAGAEYWLIASSANNLLMAWNSNSIGAMTLHYDSSTPTGIYRGDTDAFRVDEAVPEPASGVLLMTVVLGICIASRARSPARYAIGASQVNEISS